MKTARKALALLMAVAMVFSTCIAVSASASVSMSVTASSTVVSGVDYAKYNVYGSQSGHREACTVLEFNPANGYIPMPFVARGGTCDTLDTQYNYAVNKYGYEVAGVINGSYFDMASGTLSGLLISDGKITCAHTEEEREVVAFDRNGGMSVVKSNLIYHLYLNGSEAPSALRYINKKHSADSWAPDKIFYYDTHCGNTADTSVKGYEVICQKLDKTELAVGDTLEGKVLEVRANSYGASIANGQYEMSDKFVLFVKNGSSYTSYLSGLKAGDSVKIAVEEGNAAARSVMENAVSVIDNVGWLVKDGVDQTDIYNTIGEHNVKTTYARWTAFGQKADGTYVFFTSEGGGTGTTSRSLTLKDVAAAMIKLGCVNVIRMDGGGSSAMYVSNTGSGNPGYVQSSTRGVADCILIVKKSSVTTSVKADLRRKINFVKNIDHNRYSESTLSLIRDAYEDARGVYFNDDATQAQVDSAITKLDSLVAQTGGFGTVEGTKGQSKSLWVTHYNNNQAEGAGVVMTEPYSGGAWWLHLAFTPVENSGVYKLTAISNGLDNGVSTPLTVPEGGFVYALNYGNDYISLGMGDVNYTSAACNNMIADALTWKIGDTFVFNGIDFAGKTVPTTTSGKNWYDASYVCTASYAPYTVTAVKPNPDNVNNGVYVTSFDSYISAGSCVIFTPDFGTVTGANANHKWTTNVVCTYDSSLGTYVVTSVSEGTGDNVPDITLASNQILIAAHEWEESVPGSAANRALLQGASVGQTVTFYGINIADKYISAAPYMTFGGEGQSGGETSDDVSDGETSEEVSNDNDGDGIPDNYDPHIDDLGDCVFGNAYGYVFDIDYINGSLIGEDVTLMTDTSVYADSNPNWAVTVVLTPAQNGKYMVSSVVAGEGTVPDIMFGAGEIALVVHSATSNPDQAKEYPNWMDKVAALALKNGDTVTVDVAEMTVTVDTPDTSGESSEEESEEPSEDVSDDSSEDVSDGDDEEISVPDNIFWVTHYNDLQAEGAGVIITDKTIAISPWNNYYAFAPIDGTDAYMLTAISIGNTTGEGSFTGIPEGGFVYSINRGNDYPSLNQTYPGVYEGLPNYTSAACNKMLEIVSTWQVRDTFIFTGIDFENQTVPTSTPDIKWYEKGYVCTATFEEYQSETEPDKNLGDVDSDGVITTFDYLILKRAYFGTYLLDDVQRVRGDVDLSGRVDQVDYMMLKRAYFGTYVLPNRQ